MTRTVLVDQTPQYLAARDLVATMRAISLVEAHELSQATLERIAILAAVASRGTYIAPADACGCGHDRDRHAEPASPCTGILADLDLEPWESDLPGITPCECTAYEPRD